MNEVIKNLNAKYVGEDANENVPAIAGALLEAAHRYLKHDELSVMGRDEADGEVDYDPRRFIIWWSEPKKAITRITHG